MVVTNAPHLKWKESDRALALVKASQSLGAPSHETPDGFEVDFRGWSPPVASCYLRTEGDHRLAMAYGVVESEVSKLQPDRRDCVAKSFPQFWAALSLLQESLPG